MKNLRIKACAVMLLATSLLSFSACQNGGGSEKTSSAGSAQSVENSVQVSDASADESSSEASTEESSEQSSEASKSDSSDPTDAKESGELPALKNDDGTDLGTMTEGLLLYNRSVYEMFYGNENLAKNYAATVNTVASALGSDVKVYNVIVPTHCGVTLPERFFGEYGISDQKEYINTILDNLDKSVTPVNTYDIISHHRDEYIYFNTDHHWTGLGAYYAYKEFCKVAGVDYLKLSELEEGQIEGYYGSLSGSVDNSLIDADTVHYYTADKDTETFLYDENGENPQQTRLFHTYAEGANAYGVSLGGDTPLMVCKNKDGNGKKVAILKESYGNAFSPLIALTYSETHMIDFRYIEFDLQKYLKDNGIDELIIINNAMASATPIRCDEMRALVGAETAE